MAQATGQQIITQATALALADGNTFKPASGWQSRCSTFTWRSKPCNTPKQHRREKHSQALTAPAMRLSAAGLRLAKARRDTNQIWNRAFVDPERGFADRFGSVGCAWQMRRDPRPSRRTPSTRSLRDEFAPCAPMM